MRAVHMYKPEDGQKSDKNVPVKPMHMKQKLNFLVLFCLFSGMPLILILAGCTPAKQSTGTATSEEMAKAIANDNWIFIADRALPQHGRSRSLTGQYDVRCSKDTVIAYLPYFGRAYSGPVMETRSPLDFKTTDFSLSKEQNEKGRWNITIRPKDYREVQLLDFILFNNGSAQLNVQLTNRSSISFNGYVKPGK